jgi:GntR family transcriptional regulator
MAAPAQAPKHRWRRLAETLAARIGAGAYPVGGLLPAESELCAEFGLSRFTVREALRRLVAQGLIARRQGAGSVVVAAAPTADYVQSMRSLQELFQYAIDTRLEVASAGVEALDADAAALVPAPAGEDWLVIRGIRRAPGREDPIAYVAAHVPAAQTHLAEDLVAAVGPIYAVLERLTGRPIAEAEQEIAAVPMPPRVRRALGAGANAIALRFVRRYRAADGSLLITSINWHPAEHFTYRTRIVRTAAEG